MCPYSRGNKYSIFGHDHDRDHDRDRDRDRDRAFRIVRFPISVHFA